MFYLICKKTERERSNHLNNFCSSNGGGQIGLTLTVVAVAVIKIRETVKKCFRWQKSAVVQCGDNCLPVFMRMRVWQRQNKKKYIGEHCIWREIKRRQRLWFNVLFLKVCIYAEVPLWQIYGGVREMISAFWVHRGTRRSELCILLKRKDSTLS